MRGLFIVFAKIFGIFQVFAMFGGLLQAASLVVMLARRPQSLDLGTASFVVMSLVVVVAQALFFYLLVFKTEWLASRVGLDNQPEAGAFDHGMILEIGIKLIGLYVLVNSAPSLIGNLVQFFYPDQQTERILNMSGMSGREMSAIIGLAIKSILALALLLKTSSVLEWISPDRALEPSRGSD